MKSQIFDSPGGIYPSNMVFPYDLSYNHSTIDLVMEATRENGFEFKSYEIDGPHLLHVTHPKEISEILLSQINT